MLVVRRLCAVLLFLLGHVARGDSGTPVQELLFRKRVGEAIKRLKLVLDSERNPQYPSEVPHNYEDKFTLAELASRAAVSSMSYILDVLPNWATTGKEQALGWKRAHRAVTMRFSYCERCDLERTETKEVESPTKQVREKTSTWGLSDEKEVVKMVTTVVEHTWNFDTAWELSIYAGADHEHRTVLNEGGGRAGLKTTATPGSPEAEKPIRPRPSEECAPMLELDISWLLERLTGGQPEFFINRTSEKCRTPRRNAEVEAARRFFHEAAVWANRLTRNLVDGVIKSHHERPDLLMMDQVALFEPVAALFVLEEQDQGQALALTDDYSKVQQEFNRTMVERAHLFQSKFPDAAQGGLMTKDAALLLGALSHVHAIEGGHAGAVDMIEKMLRNQLVQAIGKEIGPTDFAEYAEFHNLRLFRPEFKPRAFSYAVRQPDHYPEGVVSVEAPLTSASQVKPIQTMVMHSQAHRPMRFGLNAAMELSFLGERYVHACLLHQFRGQSPPSMQLVARARQFSSFILLAGKIQAADLFEPTSALIIKDKDDLVIPLLLDTIPTPKEFRDAIESLSPEQQKFAKAFREMQLSSSLFGLCIIQIKPQMERLLNLPGGALTKEIQLTQDLMELFIRYQVSSDLLSYDGPDTVSGNEKLEAVKHHVGALQATIEAARRKELAEEEAKTQKAELERIAKGKAARENFVYHSFAMSTQDSGPVGSSVLKGAVPAGQAAPAPAEAPVAAMAATGRGNASDLDYMMLPKLMDQRFEMFDDDNALRSTKISLDTTWTKSEQPGLLSPPQKRVLGAAQQRVEYDQAFDLLDALSRSGALPVESASLHVVLAATHAFDQTLIETVVQDNINPIDKFERSSLLMASTLHGKPVAELVAPSQLEKAQLSSPTLFARLV